LEAKGESNCTGPTREGEQIIKRKADQTELPMIIADWGVI